MRATIILVLAVVLGASGSARAADAPEQILVLPDAIAWKPGPPSIPAGAQIAVLRGDPAKAGPFTVRVRFPDGYRLPPHTHPSEERATVLQGALVVGFGEKWGEGQRLSMPAGSFRVTPPGVPHYLEARGETIFQVDGIGPVSVTYVDPADDPRKR
ncbi:MAG: cupin domain-containing protein [Candidatus Rokubacteria bacterium]|nr:cupin domain-containing protein [Candidatus Rokubacteria bacterium]